MKYHRRRMQCRNRRTHTATALAPTFMQVDKTGLGLFLSTGVFFCPVPQTGKPSDMSAGPVPAAAGAGFARVHVCQGSCRRPSVGVRLSAPRFLSRGRLPGVQPVLAPLTALATSAASALCAIAETPTVVFAASAEH